MARRPSSLTYTAMQTRQNAPNTSVGSHNRRRKSTVMRPIELTHSSFVKVSNLRVVETRSIESVKYSRGPRQREVITNRGSIRLSNSVDALEFAHRGCGATMDSVARYKVRHACHCALTSVLITCLTSLKEGPKWLFVQPVERSSRMARPVRSVLAARFPAQVPSHLRLADLPIT